MLLTWLLGLRPRKGGSIMFEKLVRALENLGKAGTIIIIVAEAGKQIIAAIK